MHVKLRVCVVESTCSNVGTHTCNTLDAGNVWVGYRDKFDPKEVVHAKRKPLMDNSGHPHCAMQCRTTCDKNKYLCIKRHTDKTVMTIAVKRILRAAVFASQYMLSGY